MKLSANLGFLWADTPLPNAIRAAAAGFDAVECHWPYSIPAEDVAATLTETGLWMLGLNTARGNVSAGDFGLSALKGREEEARDAIDQAIDYAKGVDAAAVHVMAGFGAGDAAHRTYVENLRYACGKAASLGITILIEPLNRHDVPGYFLSTTDQAVAIIAEVGRPNLKLMFDCYHVQRTEEDVTHRLATLLDRIGHIQFASVPDRAAPDHGELNYDYVFRAIRALAWEAPLGAEYKPGGDTDATLGWMATARKI
ncbi:hydroxypyruvate isomerase family protein [Rhizobium terrae]|uniref:hydroxypyruvate isomerase family protein n=1 Tax=Rhizobium terrae TaxID=2171756 RepID=UPI000E3D7644|nr:TIM barrel protein [Rhizobium terrae]